MLISRFDLAAGPLLDLFAGSGALGIEGLSRGAPAATFVEQDRAALAVLGANLDACGLRPLATILARPADRALSELARSGARFAGVLLDPPYGRGLAEKALSRIGDAGVLLPAAWAAVEHHPDDLLGDAYGPLRLTVTRRYGNTALTLYASAQMVEQVAET